jgi:hypothetical protein
MFLKRGSITVESEVFLYSLIYKFTAMLKRGVCRHFQTWPAGDWLLSVNGCRFEVALADFGEAVVGAAFDSLRVERAVGTTRVFLTV